MSVNWSELAQFGFSVFPVPLREKRPKLSWKEFQQRRPTSQELGTWERDSSNAAIVTGSISGIIVLDTDSEAGEAEVERRGVPPTPSVRTAKGRHRYFKHPGAPVCNFARKLDGCDLRGDGGYVISPGSVHPSGVVYAWETSPSELPFAEAPEWLLALVAKEQAPSAPSLPPRGDAAAYAEKALDGELAALRRAPVGTRNDALNRAAFNLGQLVGGGALSEAHVEHHLLSTAIAIGLPEPEARATIKSGVDKGKKTPRIVPERTERVYAPRTGGAATVTNLAERRQEAPAPSSLRPLDPICWHGLEVPPRRWLVHDWIPDHAVTGLYGDGGVGKSLLSLQLLTACATGEPWLGRETKPCKAIGIFCEDAPDELHRRQAALNALYGVEMADLERLRLFSRVADDNALMTFGADGLGQRTGLFDALTREVRAFGAQVVVIDTAADTFVGNENIRGQVRQFITSLTALAIAIDGAVVLCAHPSVSGMTTGSGYAGSTAWNASVRSRLYLTRPPAEDEDEAAGPEERLLTRMKANYATSGSSIRLRWRDGVFVQQDEPVGLFAHIAKQSAKKAFLACLDQVVQVQGQYVSDSKNSPDRHAPKVFAQMPSALRSGFKLKDFEEAMKQLFAEGEIRIEPRGAASRNSTQIARAQPAGSSGSH